MKKLIRIPLSALFLLFVFIEAVQSQEFYKGEMFVTGQRFTHSDGHLNVDLSVDFESLDMPSDESLTITPVLMNGSDELALPAVLINGSEKQKVYQRELTLSRNKKPDLIPAVVIRNEPNMAKVFRYQVSIPYQRWMQQAIFMLRSQKCACHGKKGYVFEDKIADRIDLPQTRTSVWDDATNRQYLSWVNFVEPAPDEDTLHIVKGSIPYYEQTPIKKEEKQLGDLSSQKQNIEIYYRLRDALRGIRQEAGVELSKVKVTGYGAPVGNFKKNESNALVHGMKLKEYLRENRLTRGAPLEVTWIPEDWDSIASLVRSGDMMFRQATLDLIENVDVVKGRERMLMDLADGKSYKYLADKVFPAVMRVDYEIEYLRRPLDAAESLRLFKTGGGRSLRLTEFFSVARSYPKGSSEYNDVVDLAARLFPESPEANINAAAVALTKGDTTKARQYIDRYSTLPIAYNNMGILCLLEGNRDKAEVYLTMAAAAGVPQAQEALRKLKR